MTPTDQASGLRQRIAAQMNADAQAERDAGPMDVNVLRKRLSTADVVGDELRELEARKS